MLVEHYREKLLNSIIYFVTNTDKCGKTKLFKLLFFLDFLHFQQTGKSVTGLDYFVWEHGPAPKDLFEEFKNPPPDLSSFLALINTPDSNFFQIKDKKRFDNKHFTKRELRLLQELAFMFKEVNAEDIREISHMTDGPWDKTKKAKGMYALIDYFLALEESEDTLNLEEIKELIKDREKMKHIFND